LNTPIERIKTQIDYAKNFNVNKFDFWWRDYIAKNILTKKYYHDEELEVFNKGGTENEDIAFDMFVNRVASIVPEYDDEVMKFMKNSLYSGDFILAGRSLYGAGAKGKFKSSMSNCYILPKPEDNLESIFDVSKEMARIFSYGGGCGVDISNLRPKNAKVKNVARTSSGAVSFMNLFSSVGELIAQQNRRGAILIAMDCTHPDIEDFLTIKQNNDKVQGANISIKFTDEFMQAVKGNKNIQLYFKVKATGEEITKTINAGEFFAKFAEAQHGFAEPGALFIDTVRNWNMLSEYKDYKIDVTNPCAEFCGNEYNSCNLSSVNLYNFVKNPFTRNAEFDFERFKQTVTNAVHMANYVLDYGYDTQPLEENRKCIDNWRSIGIGVFGVADMLVALGIPYGSKDSIKVIEDIMKHMQVYTFEASIENARKNGTFDKFDWQKTVKSKYVQALIKNYGEIYNMSEKGTEAELINKLSKYGLANGTILSIAPTGSIAMLFRESGGVEPYYQVCYERTTHQLEKEHKKFTISMLAVEHMLKSSAMCKDMVLGKDITEKEIKEMFPWVVNTYDVSPYDRVDMQAVMQKYVDNAISSTINLKESVSPVLIFNLYLYAWQKGCKGITVFRDNCERINILGKNHGKTRDDKQDVSLDENAKPVEDKNSSIEVVSNTPVLDSIMPHKRNPQTSLWGRTFLYHTACVPKFYVTVNIKDGELFEVFVGADKGCQANIATITRLTSLCLRSGIKVDEVIKNLNSALCPACANQKRKGDLTVNKSCASCIASALVEMRKSLDGGKAHLDEKQKVEFTEVEKVPAEIKMVKVSADKPKLAKCPECGKNTLIAEGRCYYCSNCGWSKCD
jgi:ribonucleoside-diphosphate reductase alpha chain